VQVAHGAAHTTSAVECLALASGSARGVANAHTRIAPGADEAEARQRLSGIPTAGQPRLVLRPHLEIHHDQVQAAHGATWGALPEDALFYAASAGWTNAPRAR
jgi:Fe-S cluster assembly protein SufD